MFMRSVEDNRESRSGILFSMVLKGTGSGTRKCHVGRGMKRRRRASNGCLFWCLSRMRLPRSASGDSKL